MREGVLATLLLRLAAERDARPLPPPPAEAGEADLPAGSTPAPSARSARKPATGKAAARKRPAGPLA
jgi:hypothetical protein